MGLPRGVFFPRSSVSELASKVSVPQAGLRVMAFIFISELQGPRSLGAHLARIQATKEEGDLQMLMRRVGPAQRRATA